MNGKAVLIRDGMSDVIIDTAERMALEQGAETVNVRRILETLGITNRVFYNRFRNIDQVLGIIYEKTALKIRESVKTVYDSGDDFFDVVTDIVTDTLILSYKTKMHFSQYVFYSDSVSQSNYEWWMSEIEKIIEYAKEKHYVKDLDTKIMSYSIWCFIRGYNADALGRSIPMDEAVKNFKYSFGVLLDGMKADPNTKEVRK